MFLAACLVCGILCGLGLVHFYWAVGGRIGKDAAIPSRHGVPLMTPGPTVTALVGFSLFGMSATTAATAGWFVTPLPPLVLKGTSGLLALVFGLRAIGDFRYVGFFKRVKGSRFAERDTAFYSPLCLILAALILFILLTTVTPPP